MKRHNLRSLLLLLLLLLSAESSAFAQGNPGIFSPSNGALFNGTVTITGTAADADFLRYELAFLQEANPGAGWIVFAAGDRPVANGTLAIWDTTLGRNVGASVYPDGVYQLRLRVVRTDLSFDEYFVNGLQIGNGQDTPAEAAPTDAPAVPADIPTSVPPTLASEAGEANDAEGTPEATTPQPTPTAAPATVIPTPTPLPTRDVPTPLPTSENSAPAPQPQVLPSLTPFPSPTPQATPDGEGFVVNESDSAEPQPFTIDTALDTVFGFDYSVIGRGFRQGFVWVLIAFALLGGYLLLRTVVRWLWQTISANF